MKSSCFTGFNELTKFCPCKTCTKHSAGCHDDCSTYQNWKFNTDKIKSNQRQRRDIERLSRPMKPLKTRKAKK